jgi:hypothetical protein
MPCSKAETLIFADLNIDNIHCGYKTNSSSILGCYKYSFGAWGSVVVKACTISRTVPGSIPGGVTGIFSDIFPSDRTMALGSTQPQVKMSTRNIPGGKGGRCVRLITSPPSCAECHEIWEPKTPGTLWATPDLLRDCLPLSFHKYSIKYAVVMNNNL